MAAKRSATAKSPLVTMREKIAAMDSEETLIEALAYCWAIFSWSKGPEGSEAVTPIVVEAMKEILLHPLTATCFHAVGEFLYVQSFEGKRYSIGDETIFYAFLQNPAFVFAATQEEHVEGMLHVDKLFSQTLRMQLNMEAKSNDVQMFVAPSPLRDEVMASPQIMHTWLSELRKHYKTYERKRVKAGQPVDWSTWFVDPNQLTFSDALLDPSRLPSTVQE